jgi:hypothetical protein
MAILHSSALKDQKLHDSSFAALFGLWDYITDEDFLRRQIHNRGIHCVYLAYNICM